MMRDMCGIDDARNNADCMVVVALTDYPWRCRAVGANCNEITRKNNAIDASKNNSIAANSAKGATSQRNNADCMVVVALTDYPWRCRAVGANWNEITRKNNAIDASKNNLIAANSAKGATSQRNNADCMEALTDYPWRCRAVGANWNEITRKNNAIDASNNNSIAANSAKGATSQRVVREGYQSCGQSCGVNAWRIHTWRTHTWRTHISHIIFFLLTLLALPSAAQTRDDYDHQTMMTDSVVAALQGQLIDPVCNVQIRDDYDYLKMPTLLEGATNSKFTARFYGHTFFKNNEYFGDFVKGYTLTGYHLQPEVSYNHNRKLRVQALWDVLKYHGYDKFSKNKPYFRIVFQPTDCFRIICGYLDGNVRHGLIEPIYDPERYLTAEMENGLQLNLLRPHYDGELWLNWEKMILWGDPWQERLSVGHVSKFHVANKGCFKSDVIGEFLVAHRGGQIDSCDGQVQSLMNAALGMDFHWIGCGGVFRQLSLRAMAVQYHAIDETPDLPWSDGAGTFVKAHLRLADFGFTLGHWFGYRFVNFRGDLLYSGSAIDPANNRQHRYMAFFGGYYSKRYFDDTFVLRTGADAWYDLAIGNIEYAYMISMTVNFKKSGKK